MNTLMKFLEWVPYTRWWTARLRRERLQWLESLSRKGPQTEQLIGEENDHRSATADDSRGSRLKLAGRGL